jgi:hypothetical protein
MLVYVPAKTLAGTATETAALTFTVPRPVALAALNHLTAAGAVEPDGRARFEIVMLFVGSVQVELVPHAVTGLIPVIVEAVVGNVCPEPSLNWVEVTVRFQPPPALSPRGSTTLTGSVYVVVWSTPFRVRLKEGVPFPAIESAAPAATVAFTVRLVASAEAANTASAAEQAAMRAGVRIGVAPLSPAGGVFDRWKQ